jgi:hypothetical protein
MFDPQQKPTGTGFTLPFALLIVTSIFSPAVMVVSRPAGYVSLVLAILCSALCASLAWLSWKRYSQLSIPSIVMEEARSK